MKTKIAQVNTIEEFIQELERGTAAVLLKDRHLCDDCPNVGYGALKAALEKSATKIIGYCADRSYQGGIHDRPINDPGFNNHFNNGVFSECSAFSCDHDFAKVHAEEHGKITVCGQVEPTSESIAAYCAEKEARRMVQKHFPQEVYSNLKEGTWGGRLAALEGALKVKKIKPVFVVDINTPELRYSSRAKGMILVEKEQAQGSVELEEPMLSEAQGNLFDAVQNELEKRGFSKRENHWTLSLSGLVKEKQGSDYAIAEITRQDTPFKVNAYTWKAPLGHYFDDPKDDSNVNAFYKSQLKIMQCIRSQIGKLTIAIKEALT